jgi:formate dehydrogenase subunit delta
MSPSNHNDEEGHAAQGIAKIVRMANQIGTFFESKEDRAEGVHGVAEHINKFWEPRMRRHFFEVFDTGGEGLKPIVLEAAAQIRRPSQRVTAEQAAEADADVSG